MQDWAARYGEITASAEVRARIMVGRCSTSTAARALDFELDSYRQGDPVLTGQPYAGHLGALDSSSVHPPGEGQMAASSCIVCPGLVDARHLACTKALALAAQGGQLLEDAAVASETILERGSPIISSSCHPKMALAPAFQEAIASRRQDNDGMLVEQGKQRVDVRRCFQRKLLVAAAFADVEEEDSCAAMRDRQRKRLDFEGSFRVQSNLHLQGQHLSMLDDPSNHARPAAAIVAREGLVPWHPESTSHVRAASRISATRLTVTIRIVGSTDR